VGRLPLVVVLPRALRLPSLQRKEFLRSIQPDGAFHSIDRKHRFVGTQDARIWGPVVEKIEADGMPGRSRTSDAAC
jgi:hypothetical protein